MPRLHVIGEHDEKVLAQIKACMLSGITARAVLCADGHFGYSLPIGGVVAWRDHVAPACVGFDIACGNKAVLTDLAWPDLAPRLDEAMDAIWHALEFGIGTRDGRHRAHPVMNDPLWNVVPEWVRHLRDAAGEQLGTVGAGNHYVDLFRDEEDRVWIGVHFGSRGFGYKVCAGFLNIAAGRRFDRGRPGSLSTEAPAALALDSSDGRDYWNAMQLAGRYAHAGRDLVCAEVLSLLGARALDEVHNHHNFAWRETHFGEEVVVIRKGATPAWPGQRGFVGATMGEPAVILEGLDTSEAAESLHSTVHGAGRVMSRTQAAGPRRLGKKRRRGRGGAIDWSAVRRELKAQGIALRGGAADEAPAVYKRLADVLRHHERSVRILHTLTPVGVAMAGPEIVDPFRD